MRILLACVCMGCAARNPEPTRPPTPTPIAGGTLLVSAYLAGTVLEVDVATGEATGNLGDVPGAQGVDRGPDGALYLASETSNRILRWADGVSAPFVADDPATAIDETGGLAAPTSAVWGPDGRLYVGAFGSDAVFRYDGDGAFVDTVATGLDGADAGAVFGPDGLLYVPCFDGDEVVALDTTNGQVVRRLTEGLDRPRAVRFEADGSLWVSAWGAGQLVHFAADGTRLGFLEARAPTGFVLGADGIWVGTDQNGALRLLDAATGETLHSIQGPAIGSEGATALAWR